MTGKIILMLLGMTTIGFIKYTGTGENIHPGHRYILRGTHFISCGDYRNTRPDPEPWSAKQLMAPADLAALINNPVAKKPIIFCVGPGALIKGSIDMGPAKEKENLNKLRSQLAKLPKDAEIVIYCGCCPFEHCPNIRPAFIVLNEMKFTNARLLNLEHNLKTDWIAKGYPQ